jgi:hypothetical protein
MYFFENKKRQYLSRFPAKLFMHIKCREREECVIHACNRESSFKRFVIFSPWRNSTLWARATSFSRLHDPTQLHKPHTVGHVWTSDQPEAEAST